MTLRTLCEHYVLDYGLLWAWVSETGDRLERYYAAQRGVADAYVAEAVEIADAADIATVKLHGLRVGTRFKMAEKLDPARFGTKDDLLGAGLSDLAAVLTRISERKRDRAVTHDTAEVEDAVVVEPVKQVVVKESLYL